MAGSYELGDPGKEKVGGGSQRRWRQQQWRQVAEFDGYVAGIWHSLGEGLIESGIKEGHGSGGMIISLLFFSQLGFLPPSSEWHGRR